MNCRKDYEITWSMTLDLEAVSDGGLQIKTTVTGPTGYRHRDDTFSSSLDFLMCLPWYLEGAMTRAMHNAKNISAALAQDLENTQALCLPAKGVFCFKDPILSRDGDLVCSIDYVAGVSPKQMLDETVDVVVNKDAAQNKRATPEQIHIRAPWQGMNRVKIELRLFNTIIRQARDAGDHSNMIENESGPFPSGGIACEEDKPNWNQYDVVYPDLSGNDN